MEIWQSLVVFFYGFFAFSGAALGLKKCLLKNPYGLSHLYNLIGAFVWVDTVIFGIFWAIVSLVALILQDWMLFLLTFSLFWLVRSLGETVYWFNQQFSARNRNPYHTLWVSRFFPGDSSWVAMQIFWQCTAVVTVITSLISAKNWLGL